MKRAKSSMTKLVPKIVPFGMTATISPPPRSTAGSSTR
jgi:hypothetical protein